MTLHDLNFNFNLPDCKAKCMKSSVACFEINARTGLGQIYNIDVFIYSWTKLFKYICIQKKKKRQKPTKKGFERYLMFGLNHILVTLRWDDGRSPGHKNVCRWFLNKYKQLLRQSKLINRVFLGKCLKCNLKFKNWSKSLCLGVSESIKRLAAQSTAYALRN